jgi:hypothetical protein
MSDTISIAEYSLVEFLQTAQQYINKGWVFDFTDNANVPTSFGTFFTAVLIPSETKKTKDETVTSQVEEAPVVSSEEQPKKRGRKTKEEKED